MATEGHWWLCPDWVKCVRTALKAVEDVNKVKTGILITSRRIIFTPDTDLKDELKNTSVVITCYDRDGNEVKRVTSDDDAEIEDNENGSTGNGENGSTENGGSQNQGGTGSLTPSLTSPTISGNTQFTDSTQVSMSGPDGAEIHYTTDGSTPTAESAVYSEAFSLSATTTVKAIAINQHNKNRRAHCCVRLNFN